MNHYNWSIPSSEQEDCVENDNCQCVLRIRYNISTADYEGRPYMEDFHDATRNSKEEDEASVLQDPYVTVAGKMLSLALNTNQYGRTFQDRSHIFEIRPRPSWLSFSQRIFNLNVRGKRGNIVQTYPANEYDFVPNNLVVRHFDYVHFQWTGFDDNANNGNNNAEGTDGTDRSNIVQIESLNHNYPLDVSKSGLEKHGITPMFDDPRDRAYFAHLDQADCQSLEDLRAENPDDDDLEEDEQNCMKLNAASPYFDGGIYRMNNTGEFYYMSTRNNNFTNRSQKATLTVLPILSTWAIAVTVIGAILCLGSIGVGAMLIAARRNPLSKFAVWSEKI